MDYFIVIMMVLGCGCLFLAGVCYGILDRLERDVKKMNRENISTITGRKEQ